jgi:hypothetical protein
VSIELVGDLEGPAVLEDVELRRSWAVRSAWKTSRRNNDGSARESVPPAPNPKPFAGALGGGTGGGSISPDAPLVVEAKVELDAEAVVERPPISKSIAIDSGCSRIYAAASSGWSASAATLTPPGTVGMPTARTALAVSANTTK